MDEIDEKIIELKKSILEKLIKLIRELNKDEKIT